MASSPIQTQPFHNWSPWTSFPVLILLILFVLTQPVEGESYENAVQDNANFTLWVYSHSTKRWNESTARLVWNVTGLKYDTDTHFSHDLDLIPVSVSKLNANLYLTLVAEVSSSRLHQNINVTDTIRTFYTVLTKTNRRASSTHEFLSKPVSCQSRNDSQDGNSVHWIPRVDAFLVYDDLKYTPDARPPELYKLLFNRTMKVYAPLLYSTDVWNSQDSLIPMNESRKGGPLSLTFHVISTVNHYLMLRYDQQDNETIRSQSQMDTLKEMLLEANLAYVVLMILGLTLMIVVEVMTYLSDIEFWRSRESLKGLSTNLLVFGWISTLGMMWLHWDELMASWYIALPLLLPFLIESWKLTIGFDIRTIGFIRYDNFPYVIKTWASHKEGETEAYENRWSLYFGVFPLSYLLYFLFMSENTLFQLLLSLLFGLIVAVPQLYINYQLQSVQHLPWTVLTFKTLRFSVDSLLCLYLKPTMFPVTVRFLREEFAIAGYYYQLWYYHNSEHRHID